MVVKLPRDYLSLVRLSRHVEHSLARIQESLASVQSVLNFLVKVHGVGLMYFEQNIDICVTARSSAKIRAFSECEQV